MWLHYLLFIVAIVQGDRQQRPMKGLFRRGNDQESQFNISGTGTAKQNGKTRINLQIEIQGPAGQVGGLGAGGVGGPAGGVGGPAGGIDGPVGGAAPAEAGGQGAGSAFTEEEEIGLAKHNEFRQVHKAPLMTLDREMCDSATKYAQKLAEMGTLQHSSKKERPQQGENLSMGCSTNEAQPMEQAVTNWYNEVCEPGYDFANGGFSSGTGHFTQVVWKGSTVLGIGRAETDMRGMKCAFIVGRYKPAGNMMGDFPDNVIKGNFNADSYCASVSNNKRRLFDERGNAVMVNAPMSIVDASTTKTGPAELRGQHVELLNSKKKTSVAHKRN